MYEGIGFRVYHAQTQTLNPEHQLSGQKRATRHDSEAAVSLSRQVYAQSE